MQKLKIIVRIFMNMRMIRKLKMKDAGVCMIVGYDTQKWDTGKGTCVLIIFTITIRMLKD